ncbi:hypothetical protein DIPPA_35417 [Diplonema papillatum]|nr:hypothetical protein DIPPA_35417 [Diplonema papillatum]
MVCRGGQDYYDLNEKLAAVDDEPASVESDNIIPKEKFDKVFRLQDQRSVVKDKQKTFDGDKDALLSARKRG